MGVVPPCPMCAGAMPVVMGQFPITVHCASCSAGFFFDAARGNLVSSAGYGPTWPPPPCPRCRGSLSMPEDPPPRAHCKACDRHFQIPPGGVPLSESAASASAPPSSAPAPTASGEGLLERLFENEWFVWVLTVLAVLIAIAVLGGVVWVVRSGIGTGR